MKPFAHVLALSPFALLFAMPAPLSHATDPDKPTKRVPTFARDVAPILYAKCAPCHHSGEVAPFTLMSYDDAKDKAATLVAAVKDRFMPPWQAISHGEFKNERTLTPAQIETLDAWAKAGAPKGDIESAPKPPIYTMGWAMGEPDFIGKPAAAYTVSAEGADDYRCFVVPTNFSEGRYVSAVELRPGNRHVVHHVLVYLDGSGTARKLDGKDGKPGYSSFGGPGFVPVGSLGGWAPGLQYQKLPAGEGFWLPKGADIVLQVHYHKNGKQETDLSQVGLQFAQGPVDKRVRWDAVDNELISIQPGDSRYEIKADLEIPTPVTLLDVIPHMHLLGHDMTVTATLPDGTKRELIHVEPYDFNWQTRYTYKQPIHLPKGTRLDLIAHYDNSTGNPHNPNNPPKKVVFGEQTTNEMCFAFFTYTIDSEHIAKGQSASEAQTLDAVNRVSSLKKVFAHFDANHDGYLDVDELADLIVFFKPSADDHGTKGPDPKVAAKYVISIYGKTEKGKVTFEEFLKLTKGIQ